MKSTFLVILLSLLYVIPSLSQVTIGGSVILDDGKMPSNVKVFFKQTAPTILYDSTYTDESGNYSIDLIKGVYEISFSKIGYESQTITGQSFYTNKTISNITLLHYNLSGNVSGVLNAGTYLAVDIQIPSNDSLELKPGVIIKFFPNRGLIANGQLKAIGTEAQPIVFTSIDNTKKHNGVVVRNQTNVIRNVIFEYSHSGLNLQNCTNFLLDSAIVRFNSNGLLASNSSDIVVRNSRIISNTGGNGINFGSCTAKIIQSVISNNNNGIYNGNLNIYNSIIANNTRDGVFLDSYNATIKLFNTIIINNTAYGMRQNWQGAERKSIQAENCIFFGKSQPSSYFYGLDSYLGQVIAQNNNGHNSDVYSNLFQDPLMIDYINGNFNLQANSPCIDAGVNYLDSLMLTDYNRNSRFAKGIAANNYGYIDIGLSEFNSSRKNRIEVSLGTDTLLCRNTSITLNPGGGFQNYYWSTQSTNASISVNKTGTYSIFAENNTDFGYSSVTVLASKSLLTIDSRFNQPELVGTDYSPAYNQVVFADIDSDDDLDIIYIANRKLNLLRNNNGKFSFSGSSYTASNRPDPNYGNDWDFTNVLANDFNRDGNIEIIATMSGGMSEDSTVVFSFKDGKLFNPIERYYQKFINLVDYNNDGLMDTNGASLSANKGFGVFDNSYVYTPGRSPWVDLNSDGYKDAFSANIIKANNKDFTFTDYVIDGLSTNSVIQNIGDFDNDGKFDLVEKQYDNPSNIRIFKNNGNFSFVNSGVSVQSGAVSQFTTLDYNNDGMLDFFDGNDGAIYQNNGNFSFTKLDSKTGIVYEYPAGSSWQYRLRTADFNNDNKLDLFYNGKIYLNNDCIKNTKPTAPTNISVSQHNDSTFIIKWNRGTDNETPQRGLSYNYYIGTAPGKDDIVSSNSNLTNGNRRIVEYGNASLDTFAIFVKKLPEAQYYVGVQTIDNSFVGSEFGVYSFNTSSAAIEYNVTVASEDINMGVVSGGNKHRSGDIATLNATPTAGHCLEGWYTVDNTFLSSDNPYLYNVSGNVQIVAKFIRSPYSINTLVESNIGGTVSGSGDYCYDQLATITALPAQDYDFINWVSVSKSYRDWPGPFIVSYEPTYAFSVIESDTYIATFEKKVVANNELIKDKSTLIYPNPVNDMLFVNSDYYNEYTIYNEFSNIISNGTFVEGNSINLKSLKSGFYLIKLKNNNTVKILKFVKQ